MIVDELMLTTKPETWLCLKRIVRFGDTDAAGVMHFYQLLRWCHESWEESLELYGIPPNRLFPNSKSIDSKISILLPIVHCEASFYLPLFTGDHLEIDLFPKRLSGGHFQIETKFKRDNKDVALGLIRHCAINSESRDRCPLPEEIDLWLESSSLRLGVTSI